jgi:hypothetical protein
MDRYRMINDLAWSSDKKGDDGVIAEKNPDGEWVKWEDIEYLEPIDKAFKENEERMIVEIMNGTSDIEPVGILGERKARKRR